jgi:hypothetical protein
VSTIFTIAWTVLVIVPGAVAYWWPRKSEPTLREEKQ